VQVSAILHPSKPKMLDGSTVGKRLRNKGTDTAGSEEAGQGGDEVDEKDDDMTH